MLETQGSHRFSPLRTWHLVRYEYVQRYLPALPTVLTVLLAFFGYQLLSAASGSRSFSYDNQLSLLWILGGIWSASRSFSDLHSRELLHNWLMLPASNLEKVVVRISLVSVGYLISVCLLFSLYMVFANLILFILFEIPFTFQLGTFNSVKALYGIFTVQAFFVLGSLFFPKRPLSGTVMTLLIATIGILVTAITIGGTLINGRTLIDIAVSAARFFTTTPGEAPDEALSQLAAAVYRVIKITLLPVLCTAIYFKVKTIQKHKIKFS